MSRLANTVTFAGLALCAVGAVYAAVGDFGSAAGWILLGFLCDAVDGKIARSSGVKDPFGALWDSVLDRYSDALICGGVAFYFARSGSWWLAAMSLSALAAALITSYVRARAEGLGYECRVGFWERPERAVVLFFGLLTAAPAAAVVVLGTLPHGTAIRRIVHVYRRSRPGDAADRSGAGSQAPKRMQVMYWIFLVGVSLVVLGAGWWQHHYA
ncbi:MAG: CDP-alcohol phosphatidyltransferase family protein [Candidatus Omnitrophica bacterium]|nr:CDP-alcohol phosphatidyltransferase family protein [Candidatus Omnitrophota bacterium]